MAFGASGLSLMLTAVGGGPQIWYYSSTDAHATVEGAGYFAKMGFGTSSDSTTKGMRVGDIVFAYKTSATVEVTVHVVTAINAAGNATVSAATLA